MEAIMESNPATVTQPVHRHRLSFSIQNQNNGSKNGEQSIAIVTHLVHRHCLSFSISIQNQNNGSNNGEQPATTSTPSHFPSKTEEQRRCIAGKD
nr:hypothetical protein Iba_chr13aCG9240 [Ipomoea batatas]